MAPHDTNSRKEARRHIVPLVGMAAVVLCVAVGFFLWVSQVTEGADEPEAAEETEAVE